MNSATLTRCLLPTQLRERAWQLSVEGNHPGIGSFKALNIKALTYWEITGEQRDLGLTSGRRRGNAGRCILTWTFTGFPHCLLLSGIHWVYTGMIMLRGQLQTTESLFLLTISSTIFKPVHECQNLKRRQLWIEECWFYFWIKFGKMANIYYETVIMTYEIC